MLVDTGSAVTLMHKRLGEKLATQHGPLQTQGAQVVSANSSPLQIIGKIDGEITVAGICADHPVLVAEDISHDILLGFLESMTVQFNLEKTA